MAVSPTYRTFILEQLGRCTPAIRAKSMFGGVGIYGGELFFALMDDDTLYFKVDDVTRPEFEARGTAPFQPMGPEHGSMGYYEVPVELLEDVEALRPWVEAALGVAARKKKPRGTKRRTGKEQ